MQVDAIAPGQTVIIVDDIIATGASISVSRAFATRKPLTNGPSSPSWNHYIFFSGGSAAAAGELATKQGGMVLRYLFVAEVTSLEGAAKLGAPVYSIVKF